MSVQPDAVKRLLASSKAVLLDCCLENGAVVAANIDKSYYPKQANDYRYVWPRDAGFILYALELLGEYRMEQFANWLFERAEQFNEEGLWCRRYATNGAASYPYNELQPDQSGALLWAFCSSSKLEHSDRMRQAVQIIADSLVKIWDKHSFTKQIYDVWEKHRINPGDSPYAYTLASCAHGLRLAAQVHSNPQPAWTKAAEEMVAVLDRVEDERCATIAGQDDASLDASLFGLAWPFSVGLNRAKLLQTFSDIDQQLGSNLGILRFAGDMYDGEVSHGKDNNTSAGAWPLLSLWEALAYHKLGRAEQADAAFTAGLNRLPDPYIPEQIFNDKRIGVKPLGWAHALFVIANHELTRT